MFSITADGVLFLNGEQVGTITVDDDRTQRDGMRLVRLTARGRTLELGSSGDTLLSSSIASGGAVTEVRS
jgi:hypothetical protein